MSEGLVARSTRSGRRIISHEPRMICRRATMEISPARRAGLVVHKMKRPAAVALERRFGVPRRRKGTMESNFRTHELVCRVIPSHFVAAEGRRPGRGREGWGALLHARCRAQPEAFGFSQRRAGDCPGNENSPAIHGWEHRQPTIQSPVRDGRTVVAVRKDLSSLTGLAMFPHREPSHEWLGYFQGAGKAAGAAAVQDAGATKRDWRTARSVWECASPWCF